LADKEVFRAARMLCTTCTVHPWVPPQCCAPHSVTKCRAVCPMPRAPGSAIIHSVGHVILTRAESLAANNCLHSEYATWVVHTCRLSS
jgi:hypothetical protein